MLLDMGLIQKHEALMKLNPNLKEEDAIAKVKEIDAEKEKKAKEFLNSMPTNNGTGQPIGAKPNGNFGQPKDGNKPDENIK
jgi:hypothetical protein